MTKNLTKVGKGIGVVNLSFDQLFFGLESLINLPVKDSLYHIIKDDTPDYKGYNGKEDII
jgi:hypothetical protein